MLPPVLSWSSIGHGSPRNENSGLSATEMQALPDGADEKMGPVEREPVV